MVYRGWLLPLNPGVRYTLTVLPVGLRIAKLRSWGPRKTPLRPAGRQARHKAPAVPSSAQVTCV
jgi:hypothetical protein